MALVLVGHPLVTVQGAPLQVHCRTRQKPPTALRTPAANLATNLATRRVRRKHRMTMTMTTARLRHQRPQAVSRCSQLPLVARLAKGPALDQMLRRPGAKVAAAVFSARRSDRRVRLARLRPRVEIPRSRNHQRRRSRSVCSKALRRLVALHRVKRNSQLVGGLLGPLPRQAVVSALFLAMHLAAAASEQRKQASKQAQKDTHARLHTHITCIERKWERAQATSTLTCTSIQHTQATPRYTHRHTASRHVQYAYMNCIRILDLRILVILSPQLTVV